MFFNQFHYIIILHNIFCCDERLTIFNSTPQYVKTILQHCSFSSPNARCMKPSVQNLEEITTTLNQHDTFNQSTALGLIMHPFYFLQQTHTLQKDFDKSISLRSNLFVAAN